MSAPPRFSRFRPFVSLAQKMAGVGGPRREVVFSDRRMLTPAVSLRDGVTLQLRVDVDRLTRSGTVFDPKTARAFALVPACDGSWSRVELEFIHSVDELETSFATFSAGCAVDPASLWREGVAFGLDVPGYDATTTVWAQRHGENVRPTA